MFYAWDITIPKNTTEDNPIKKELELTHGVITKIAIKFPIGCSGMVKVRLLRFETPIMPLNRDGWVTGDGETVEATYWYELTDSPYTLNFLAISPNTQYDHTVTVRINILPPEAAGVKVLVELLRKFFSIIGVA